MNAPVKNGFTHYHFEVTEIDAPQGREVVLSQQDGIEDPTTIVVHASQLREACQKLGILYSDPDAEREAERLTRRLVSLAARIAHLNDWLQEKSGTKHADLTYEQTYSQATADLATEFTSELEESRPTQPAQRALL